MLDNDGLVLFCYLNQNNKFSDSVWIGTTDKSIVHLNWTSFTKPDFSFSFREHKKT